MNTIFNSLDKFFKNPIGPLKNGEVLTLRVKIQRHLNPVNVLVTFREFKNEGNIFTLHMKNEKEDSDYFYFKLKISNIEVNIYQYYFSFQSNGQTKFIVMSDDSWEGKITDDLSPSLWQLTVYNPVKTHPNMQNGIMYQIFPDRFYNSGLTTNVPEDRKYREWGEIPFYDNHTIGTDFFGGDLKGIIVKLNYLKKLNVSVLYLNPIWEAQSNHRYNTGDYENIDPVLGTIEDLKELVKKAHSLGMIVILDAVLNHTGSDSVYFNKYNRYPNEGAYNTPDSLYYNWFYFKENRDNYESWWGFKSLPKVNQNNPDFIKYIFDEGGVIDKWYETGIDGLRLDVADELENETLERINEASRRNRDSIVIIGEVWDNASNKCNYGHRMNYFLGQELTSVMNYPVKDVLLAYIRYGGHWSKELKRVLISVFVEDYPREIANSLMNFLSTHDTVRAITKLCGHEVDENDRNWQFNHDKLSRYDYSIGRRRLMLSYLIIYFLPGVPSIFYGDEIGMYGYKDPFCRKCFTWDRIDKKIFRFMKSIGRLRNSISRFLKKADFDVGEIDDEKCILIRKTNNRFIFLFVNRSNRRICLDAKNYVLKYIKQFNNEGVQDIRLLYRLGQKSFITSIEEYGAIIVEATVTY